MKKSFLIYTIVICAFFLLSGYCFAADNPVYDPTYNSNSGAFYANGTEITIDKDIDNNTVVTWNGGSQIVPSTVTIFGGGIDGSSYENTSINMNDGVVSTLVGGGVSVQETNPAIVGNSNIIVSGGTVLESVFGGGILYTEVNNATIIVNGGTIAAICGGGAASAVVNGVYYSIGSELAPQDSPNRTNNATVIINDGIINSEAENYGLLYGGGQGYSFVGETEMTINSGDMSKAYVTAGGSNGYTGSSNVEIKGGNIFLFQSVNRGTVEGATVNVTGGEIQKFYVGGETEDVSVTGTIANVEVALLGGTIDSLNAGKSNSQPIVTDQENFVVIKTAEVEVLNDNITTEKIEINYTLNVTPQILKIQKGESKNVDVQITTVPAGYEGVFKDVSYLSSNEEVAIVSSEGLVTGVSKGTVVVEVSVLDENVGVEVLVQDVNDYIFFWVLFGILVLILFLGMLFLY